METSKGKGASELSHRALRSSHDHENMDVRSLSTPKRKNRFGDCVGAIVKAVVPSATELECFGKAKLSFGRNLEGSLIRSNVER